MALEFTTEVLLLNEMAPCCAVAEQSVQSNSLTALWKEHSQGSPAQGPLLKHALCRSDGTHDTLVSRRNPNQRITCTIIRPRPHQSQLNLSKEVHTIKVQPTLFQICLLPTAPSPYWYFILLVRCGMPTAARRCGAVKGIFVDAEEQSHRKL